MLCACRKAGIFWKSCSNRFIFLCRKFSLLFDTLKSSLSNLVFVSGYPLHRKYQSSDGYFTRIQLWPMGITKIAASHRLDELRLLSFLNSTLNFVAKNLHNISGYPLTGYRRTCKDIGQAGEGYSGGQIKPSVSASKNGWGQKYTCKHAQNIPRYFCSFTNALRYGRRCAFSCSHTG